MKTTSLENAVVSVVAAQVNKANAYKAAQGTGQDVINEAVAAQIVSKPEAGASFTTGEIVTAAQLIVDGATDNKEKNSYLSVLRVRCNRALEGTGLKAGIKTTGKNLTFSLVAETEKAEKDLPSILKELVDSYGFATVQAELTKLATVKAAA